MSTSSSKRRTTAPRRAWFVYVIRARGGVLYVGITLDVQRRFDMHVAGSGAKFLRGRAPLELAYRRKLGDHGLALRVELRIKRLSKLDKEALVRTQPSRARLLARVGIPSAECA